MDRGNLRASLPMETGHIVLVAAAIVEAVERLHARGVVHGAIDVDNVVLTRQGDGGIEVSLVAATGRGGRGEDVAAIGSVISTMLRRSGHRLDSHDPIVRALDEIAASARRSVIGVGLDAVELRRRLDALSERAPDLHFCTDAPHTWMQQCRNVDGGEGRRRWAARAGLVAWVLLLVATVAWLPGLARQVSPPPVLDGIAALERWVAGRDAATAIAGVLRAVVHAIALYLLASTVVACGLEMLPSRAAHRLPLLDRLTAPPVRRIVHAAFSVSLTVGALGSLASRPPRPRPPSAATTPTTTTTTTTITTITTSASTTTAPEPPTHDAPPAEPGDRRTWTVRPGDSFWSIAERLVSEAVGRPATDEEVDPYWRQLVAANRSRLADPDNEDLLFEGQVLGVPPLPVPPATPTP